MKINKNALRPLKSVKRTRVVHSIQRDRKYAHRLLSRMLTDAECSAGRVTGVYIVVTQQDDRRNVASGTLFNGFFENAFEMIGALEVAKSQVMRDRFDDID